MGGFVFAADWHLSRLTWKHRPRLTGDSFFALEQIVSICIEYQADLLAAGDLCDKDHPDSAAVACLCRQMQRMQDAGLEVFYVEGQHEMASPPWMSVHPWPKFVHRKTFRPNRGNGPPCYGLSWQNRESFAEEALRIPEGCIFMCHQVWNEHMGGVVTFPEAYVQQVAPKTRCVLSGDYHKHQVTQYNTPDGVLNLFSSGAISVRNLGELDDKAVYYFNDAGQYISIPLRGRPYTVSQIQDLAQLQPLRNSLDAIADGLPEYMRLPICVLKFPSTLEGAWSEINRIFGDAHLWAEEQRVDVLPVTIEQQDMTIQRSIPDLIAANIPQSDLRDDLVFLVDSHLSPVEAVKALVTRIQGAGADEARTTLLTELV